MQRYIVKKGDTLPKLALKFYGDPTQWRRILIANPTIADHPDWLCAGQALSIPTNSDRVREQSSTFSQEQLQGMDRGLCCRMDSEALDLLVGTTALLRGLRKAGIRVFSQKAAGRRARAICRAIVDPRTGWRRFPNTPFQDKTRDPRKVAGANVGQFGRQGAEIGRIYREFIETGKWPLKRRSLGGFQMRTLNPRLLGARQEYFRALSEHLA